MCHGLENHTVYYGPGAQSRDFGGTPGAVSKQRYEYERVQGKRRSCRNAIGDNSSVKPHKSQMFACRIQRASKQTPIGAGGQPLLRKRRGLTLAL